MTDLEKEFAELMIDIYRRAKSECGYNAQYFLEMLGTKGPLGTAKYLLNEPEVSSGFVSLYKKGCLHLSLEAQLLANDKFWVLFTESELATAWKWYSEYLKK